MSQRPHQTHVFATTTLMDNIPVTTLATSQLSALSASEDLRQFISKQESLNHASEQIEVRCPLYTIEIESFSKPQVSDDVIAQLKQVLSGMEGRQRVGEDED